MDAKTLVKKGYKQAAFRYAKNADKFAAGWKKKGHSVKYLRSSGPVSEGGYRKNAWYVMASEKKKRTPRPTKPKRRRSPTNVDFLPRFKF